MEVALLLVAGGMATGLFGSLLGLGGGVLLVPLLTFGFDLPVREAVGVSLVCVIVTSGATAAVFLDRRIANLRLGMVLELFTAVGALIGGTIAFLLDERLLAGLFSALLVYTAATMLRTRAAGSPAPTTDPGSTPAGAGTGTVPVPAEPAEPGEPAGPVEGVRARRVSDGMSGTGYRVRAPVAGAVGGVGAGIVSALLGIGGGLVMVPVMHVVMRVPLRVATATSNLMIGITASTSALVYLLRGGIDAYATGPAAIGVFIGAAIGSRVAHRVDVRALRLLFAGVLAYTAILMLGRAVGAP
ncbi:MAG TPA: sulfite exporter TauE/SafE family protein [Candidatus Sulfomarinibacteraceae bacterium]|nr:sulfite exporter TauE/SafE family protein [Candidatus Sulfomarinibacteraceae bacterium]